MRLPAALGGSFFVCDLRDAISREVCLAGFYEPQFTSLLSCLLYPGMTFLDVGANWGYFSLLAANLLKGQGAVIALEPDPRMFARLESNVARNGMKNVLLQQLAAGDCHRVMTLAGYKEEHGNFGVSRLVEGREQREGCFEVQTCSVDALLDSLGVDFMDLVKIDVEGAEDLVVAGMRTGLERHRYRRVLLELHPSLLAERNRKAEDVLYWFTRCGYLGWSIDHSAAACREAAYNKRKPVTSYLKPVANGGTFDAWPHLLWISPGLEFRVPAAIRS